LRKRYGKSQIKGKRRSERKRERKRGMIKGKVKMILIIIQIKIDMVKQINSIDKNYHRVKHQE